MSEIPLVTGLGRLDRSPRGGWAFPTTMVFSLADYVLGNKEPRKRRPSSSNAESSPLPNAKEADGKPVASNPDETERHAPAGEDGATAAIYLQEINRLLFEVSQEWTELEEAIAGLSNEISPEDFSGALKAAGLMPVDSTVDVGELEIEEVPYSSAESASTKEKQDKVQQPPKEERSTTELVRDPPRPSQDKPRSPAPKPPEKKVAPPKKKVAPPKKKVAPPKKKVAPPKKKVAPPKETPAASEKKPAVPEREEKDRDTAIDSKLEEVLKLLRKGLSNRPGVDPSPAVTVPENVTQEIAKEVAGRLKETVLATLKDSPNETPKKKKKKGKVPQEPSTEEERIPLGDVVGLIDQLTKRGFDQ